jgi:signal transduction histidine kinase
MVTVATAFGVALLAQSVFSAGFWFIFLVAVIVSARLGKGPGWLAIFLSTAAVQYLFTSSAYILPRPAGDILLVSNFLASAVAVSWAVFQASRIEAPGRDASDADGQMRDRAAALEKANAALLLEVDKYKRSQAEVAKRTRAELELQIAEIMRTNKILTARIAGNKQTEDELRRTHESLTKTQAHAAHVSRMMSMAERTRAGLESQMAEMTRTNKFLTARITENKQTEDELRRTHESLTKTQAHVAQVSRMMSMEELTASIAHEVNQPLTAVITSARACERWLSGEPPNVETARASLERIVRDGNRASQVISRIRSLFKRNPPQKEPLDVNELILEMIALQHSEGSVDGVAIQTALAADLPILYADRVQLQQVVLNLMRNAIDAMTEIADRPKQLYINSCKEQAGRVSVSFTDSGVGLSPDHADKIFNAFFTTKTNGLGMGLAITRSIIESHGGRIRAKPMPQGTTFEFTLPTESTADA